MSGGYTYSTRSYEEILRENQTTLRLRVEQVQRMLNELAASACASFIRAEITELQQQINSAATLKNDPLSGIRNLSNFSVIKAKQKGEELKRQHDQLMQERAELQKRHDVLHAQIAQTAAQLQVFNPQAYAQLQEHARQVVAQHQDQPTAGYAELETIGEQLAALNAKHQALVNHGTQTRKTFMQWQQAGAHPEDMSNETQELEQILNSAGDVSVKLHRITQMQSQVQTRVRQQMVGNQLAQQAIQESEELQQQELRKLEALAQQLRKRESVRKCWQQALAQRSDAALDARCRAELTQLMEASVADYESFSEAHMHAQIAQVRQRQLKLRQQEMQVLRAEEERLAAATARAVELEELRRIERANAQALDVNQEVSLEELRILRQQAQREYELRHERERLEEARRKKTHALYDALKEIGFDIDDPIITPQGEVLMRSRRNQGAMAQALLYLDGQIALKLDNYGDLEVDKCDGDIEQIVEILAQTYGIEATPTSTFFNDPRRIKKAAKTMPSSAPAASQQQYRRGAK